MAHQPVAGTVSELKIPARPEFIIVAKRAAGALGTAAGFSLEGIDDLNIAVAQACEKAIVAGDSAWGSGRGVLKLVFRLVDGGIEVEVRSLPDRAHAVADAPNQVHVAELARAAEGYRETAARLSRQVTAERQERVRAEREVRRLKQENQLAERHAQMAAEAGDVDLEDVAFNMISLFVDELRYKVDARGSMRMRMVKYRVD
ncbi:MAG: hypothetical protein QOE92_1228 [Chloroflexota bacterium]|jgi:hypothetical protein|nr:hypothetical protein [Chloroflexota bacterium]